MHTPSPVFSSMSTLLSLVSLWVTRRGSLPSRRAWRATEQSASRDSMKSISSRHSFTRPSLSSATAAFSLLSRSSVSWNRGMVSWRVAAG